ncbi:MAG: hypothetical protein AMJ65_06865 [Phycisphaerae bacterium SG8_4]|nr:MAG: hypothetical protein AMJ65_06865 [Phycisphaerae bacterium SG8_4]
MSERYVCLVDGVRAAGRVMQKGDTFERLPWMGPLTAWVNKGNIRRVTNDDGQSAKQEIPPDLDSLKKAELIDVIDGLGFSIDDVTGTGSGGNVTKADLILFLKSKA